MIKQTLKGTKTYLSNNLHQSEFDCGCHYKSCVSTPYSTQLLERFEMVRALSGDIPLKINSGFRCSPHNQDVKGSALSQHKLGLAIDIAFPDHLSHQTFIKICTQVFPFTKIYASFIHCDVRGLE